MEWLVWFLVSLLVSAVVIWIVGRLNLGMTVSGFGAAFITALVIAIITAVLTWLLGLLGISLGGPGLLGAIINIIVAAIVLMLADRFVPGMKVSGFVGALVAAIAIGVVAWLLSWLLGLLGINLPGGNPLP